MSAPAPAPEVDYTIWGDLDPDEIEELWAVCVPVHPNRRPYMVSVELTARQISLGSIDWVRALRFPYDIDEPVEELAILPYFVKDRGTTTPSSELRLGDVPVDEIDQLLIIQDPRDGAPRNQHWEEVGCDYRGEVFMIAYNHEGVLVPLPDEVVPGTWKNYTPE